MLRRLRFGLVALLVAQFVPVRHDNPPIESSKTIFATEKMPANVSAVLHRSCMDCHSNQTRWPWYSYVAPATWRRLPGWWQVMYTKLAAR